jgi:hypothetical protein
MHRPIPFALLVLTFAAAFFGSIHPCATGPSKADLFALELAACQEAAAATVNKPSKCGLFGKIKVVEHFPDVKIKVVEHFPDIKVKLMEHFADGPGEWTMVEHFPDYKIKFVEHFPDYKIKFVEHFPGCD